MAKSFGDAMIVDLTTRTIRCLTCDVPGAAFPCVMHVVTGMSEGAAISKKTLKIGSSQVAAQSPDLVRGSFTAGGGRTWIFQAAYPGSST